jgi:hypothetical protein
MTRRSFEKELHPLSTTRPVGAMAVRPDAQRRLNEPVK